MTKNTNERARIAAHYYGQMLVLHPGATLDVFRDHIAELYGARSWAELPRALQVEAVKYVSDGRKAARERQKEKR